ncbi:MAG: hypothetical protein GY913_35725 [Proteobacteria bacterium]|nr:hypothetical protein [Pseudomonadota bacterium]MCP4922282.1 hypothetical protein [Pseudomonadota bacterium]
MLPDREVDALLPLSISPSPTEVERVLVGRVEVITPEMQETARSLEQDPQAWEEAFGRFAEPVGASLSW